MIRFLFYLWLTSLWMLLFLSFQVLPGPEPASGEKGTQSITMCSGSESAALVPLDAVKSTGTTAVPRANVPVPQEHPRHPQFRPYTQGSATEVARLANSPDELAEMQQRFEAAEFAASTRASKSSRAKLGHGLRPPWACSLTSSTATCSTKP